MVLLLEIRAPVCLGRLKLCMFSSKGTSSSTSSGARQKVGLILQQKERTGKQPQPCQQIQALTFQAAATTKNNISISPMLYPEGSGGERQILLCINSHLQYIWQRNFIVLTWLGFYHPQCRNTTAKLVNQLPSCSNDSLTTRRTITFKYRIISVYTFNYPWCYGDFGSLHNILGTIDMCSLHWVKLYSHPLKD